MAKESMKAREVKRAKMVAQYAEKRAALKKIVNDPNSDPAAAYEAAQKLQSIPRNANPIRLHNHGSSQGLHPLVRPQPYPVPRDGISGLDSRREEGQLVISVPARRN